MRSIVILATMCVLVLGTFILARQHVHAPHQSDATRPDDEQVHSSAPGLTPNSMLSGPSVEPQQGADAKRAAARGADAADVDESADEHAPLAVAREDGGLVPTAPEVPTSAEPPPTAADEPSTADDAVPSEESESVEGDLSLAGRTLLGTGSPVAGLRVTLEPMQGDRVRTSTKVSDAQGYFEFAGLLPGDYRLSSQKTEQFGSQTIYAQAGLRSANLVVQRLLGTTIEGRVTNEQGQPLAGVSVIAPSPSAQSRTADNGRYRIDVEGKEGQGVVLQFKTQGYVDEILHIGTRALEQPAPLKRDIQLRELGSGAFRARVLDEQLNPIRGALVQINSPTVDTHQHTLTAEDGSFTITGILPADDYEVRASAPGPYTAWRQQPVSISGEIEADDIILQSLSDGRVSGSIVDVQGNAIPGFSLLAVSSGANGRSITIVSDEFGNFAVDSLAAGSLSFLSRSVPNVRIEGATLGEEQELFLTLVLDWGSYAVGGRVTNARSEPVAGASVVMTWRQSQQGLVSTVTRPTTTDDRGQFRFTELGPGARDIVVTAQGTSSRRIVLDPSQIQQSVEIQVQ